MKPTNVLALVSLCSLLATAGVIVHNYSTACAATRTSLRLAAPFPHCSEDVRRRFIESKFLPHSEEECQFMALSEEAMARNDVKEMHVIQEAHARHTANAAKNELAIKKRDSKEAVAKRIWMQRHAAIEENQLPAPAQRAETANNWVSAL